jgi:hypothetical protein
MHARQLALPISFLLGEVASHDCDGSEVADQCSLRLVGERAAIDASSRVVSRLRAGIISAALGIVCIATADVTLAQSPQVQIPTLQACNKSLAVGRGVVTIDARRDTTHAGSFKVEIEASCDPQAGGYPTGSLAIRGISMTDSSITGDLISGPTIDQMTSAGDKTPTAYVNGRCAHHPPSGAAIVGCRFWLMVVDNQQVSGQQRTPDIVSVLVFDGAGNTVFYATGPVVSGAIRVTH